MDEWRISTYRALYEARQALCRRIAAQGPAEQVALSAYHVEQHALRRGCLHLLQQRCAQLTSHLPATAPTLAQGTLGGPGRLQRIEDMFDWEQMSAQFYREEDGSDALLATGRDAPSAAPLAAFLTADLARVLVPVRTRSALALLHLLAAGQVWEGSPDTAPVDAGDIELASALKSAGIPATQGGHLCDLQGPAAAGHQHY